MCHLLEIWAWVSAEESSSGLGPCCAKHSINTEQKLVLGSRSSARKCSHWGCSPPVSLCRSISIYAFLLPLHCFLCFLFLECRKLRKDLQDIPNSRMKSTQENSAEACLNRCLKPPEQNGCYFQIPSNLGCSVVQILIHIVRGVLATPILLLMSQWVVCMLLVCD